MTISFYEAMTAAALGCFERCGVEFGVLEVGLGGRLDATTAVSVDASILTTVELEHTELLGDTVEAIAREKVPIFRPGKPAIVGVEHGPALRVAEQRAREIEAELWVSGRDFVAEPRYEGADLVVQLRGPGAECSVRVPGGAPLYEARALALAWACLRALDREQLVAGEFTVPRAFAPCCFEVFEHGDQSLVLDGAHTEASVALLLAEVDRRFGARARLNLLFGCAAGKRWKQMLALLAPRCDAMFIAPVEGTASTDPAEIVADLAERGITATPVDGAAAGIEQLLRAEGLGLVAGSFYLAGASRGLVGR